LKNASKGSICALHKFVFEKEGNRNNRERLREFSGFQFDENDGVYKAKCVYVQAKLTERDLISICLILNISHDVENMQLHIFQNLRFDQLLGGNEVEDPEESDEDKDDDEENQSDDEIESMVANSAGTNPTSERDQKNNLQPVPIQYNEMPRFALSFRDIEEPIKQFEGTDEIPVDVWISDFEDQAVLIGWNDMQKLIFAKKSLKGVAKLFVLSEKGINSWSALKSCLLSEFRSRVSSKQIHKQLGERKRRSNESVQEYFYRMKDIASRGNVEEDALIQYVIDGIDELSINKSMLYGARNMTECKYKLKDYQTISAKSHFGENCAKEKKAQAVHGGSKTGKKEIVCYNCGEKGHLSSGCNNKEKGRKCFKCNKFGHISKNCPQGDKSVEECKPNARVLSEHNNMTSKVVSIKNQNCVALFDTDSKYNILREDIYDELPLPKLKECSVYLIGFGKNRNANKIKPIGQCKQAVRIDSSAYELNFFIVPLDCMDTRMIIGEELCLQAEISFGPSGLRVRNLNNLCKENIPSNLLKIDTVINNDELDINESAGECAKQEVSELIMNYKPLKSKSTNIEMKILLNDESPIFSRPRRFAFAETNVIDEQIEQWLDNGIIEESDSEFTSPVVLAKKNDGSQRLCVDFRHINKVIVKDHFPLPLIDVTI